MQWTERIRQVKILLVIAAILIAVVSLLVSHYLVRDLSNEERHKMEVWAQALRALNNAGENTDVSLVLSVMRGIVGNPIVATLLNALLKTVVLLGIILVVLKRAHISKDIDAILEKVKLGPAARKR